MLDPLAGALLRDLEAGGQRAQAAHLVPGEAIGAQAVGKLHGQAVPGDHLQQGVEPPAIQVGHLVQDDQPLEPVGLDPALHPTLHPRQGDAAHCPPILQPRVARAEHAAVGAAAGGHQGQGARGHRRQGAGAPGRTEHALHHGEVGLQVQQVPGRRWQVVQGKRLGALPDLPGGDLSSPGHGPRQPRQRRLALEAQHQGIARQIARQLIRSRPGSGVQVVHAAHVQLGQNPRPRPPGQPRGELAQPASPRMTQQKGRGGQDHQVIFGQTVQPLQEALPVLAQPGLLSQRDQLRPLAAQPVHQLHLQAGLPQHGRGLQRAQAREAGVVDEVCRQQQRRLHHYGLGHARGQVGGAGSGVESRSHG